MTTQPPKYTPSFLPAVPYTSQPGKDPWVSRASANDCDWRAVTYGNGMFVATGITATPIMYSGNGINWYNSPTTGVASKAWRGLAYGNGKFVAVARTATTPNLYAMYSSNGIDWSQASLTNSSEFDREWLDVTFGNGLFVAVSSTTGSGTAANRVMTSPDGVNWTTRVAANTNDWRGITYGRGLYVAVSETGSGNQVMTSNDAITWTARTTPTSPDSTQEWSGVTYGNGLFVSVAQTGTNRVMTSNDGITWTLRSCPTVSGWLRVRYGAGYFVAFGNNGITAGNIMYSADGVTWTLAEVSNRTWADGVYANGVFVAVSYSGTGNRVATSGFFKEQTDFEEDAFFRSTNSSAALEVTSTSQGILFPRMTTAQRDAITTPAAGLVIYNTSTSFLNFYNGAVWAAF